MSGPPPPSPTTTTPGAPSTTSTTRAPQATSTTACPTTTVARSASTTVAAPNAAPRTAAPAGTYRFDTTGSARHPLGTMAFPAVTTLTVDPPGGTRQHATRDLRDANRNGPVFEPTFEYQPDGVYLVSLKVTATVLLFTATEEIRAPSPILLLPTGAGPGAHKDFDLPVSTGTAHLTVDALRQERITVGGQSVDSLVVRLAAVGALGGRLELTVWLPPSTGLWVKERFVADATSPDGTTQYHADYDATLQALPS